MGETKFAVNNYNGITVSCTKFRWDTHISPGHEIMNHNVDAVKDTIKDPEIVFESSQFEESEVYFKKSPRSTYNAYTKVIVRYYKGKNDPEATVGDVVTAFPQKQVKGGIGDVVYKKSDNKI